MYCDYRRPKELPKSHCSFSLEHVSINRKMTETSGASWSTLADAETENVPIMHTVTGNDHFALLLYSFKTGS